MTDEQREQISEATKAAFVAKERFNGLSMMNVPSEYDARQQQAIDYEIAKAEYYEAQKKLDEIVRSFKQ